MGGLAAIGLGLTLALPAAADIDIRDVSMHRGFDLGTFRIWPRVEVQGGYDSNVFFQAKNDVFLANPAFNAPVGAPLMRVAPGLRIENPDYGDIRLIFDAEGNYRQFFSGFTEIDDGQSNFGARVDFAVDFFERRDASFRVFDRFVHELTTPNFSTDMTFNRFVNDAGLRVAIHPGGVEGRKALEVGAEYAFHFERFVDFTAFDSNTHKTRLYGVWRFFPKTSLEIDAQFHIRQWLAPEPSAGRINSMPLRVTAALNGYITKRISTLLRVGYAQGFYEDGPELQTVIGQAVLTWLPLSTTQLSVGYQRDFVDSLYGNFYTFDRFYVDAKQRLFGRLQLQLTAGYQLLEFASFDPAAAGPSNGFIRYTNVLQRSESALDAKVAISYDFARYIGLVISYEYRQLFSDFFMTGEQVGDPSVGLDPAPGVFPIDRGGFVRHFVLAGVALHY